MTDTDSESRAVIEMGDSIDELERDNCLFIVNHQSTADVPVLMNMLTAHGRAADSAMWIMDVLFKWSNFGVVSQLHRDFFIECVSAGATWSAGGVAGSLLVLTAYYFGS